MKLLFVHGYDAGDNGSEGADDGQEAGKDDGLAAVLVIKLLCLVEMSFLEQLVVLPMEEEGPALVTKPIAQGIAEDAADGDQAP